MNLIMHFNPPHEDWFARVPNFRRNPNAKVSEEFRRLGAQRNWRPQGRTWRKHWYACMDAEYNRLIGYRDIDLMTWQQMCAKLGLHANLRSITKCKRGVSHVHVNIVDIIDCWEADERPQLFKSRKELSNYVKTGMRFPLDIIRQDKVLRVFLAHID
ncbi:uncharacterized protein N7469_009313 [Penicillium citrinum]|uniref:Uncharacterized protein n=1 Tax=Penicillium citrinum TaxID=5077 RepID=A0A9W9NQL8_PENCI|nr:uncharacterized protein N7469_009313 [Penicillium citrinum]KAJ5223073.1 hypothetical protein N7469_009313 [Penicillium citrinum]